MQAVGYVRVSTDKQDLGAEAQAASVEAWCLREGLELVAVFLDKDVKSDAEDKPGLMEAIGHVAGRALVASKRDRFARDTMLVGVLVRAVAKAGGVIRTTDGASSNDSPEGKLMAGIVDCFAAYELALIRSRTKAALAIKKARGERVGGLSYGYIDVAGKLVACEVEQEAIRLAKGWRREGKSLRWIVRRIDGMGRKWSPEAVRRVTGGGRRTLGPGLEYWPS